MMSNSEYVEDSEEELFNDEVYRAFSVSATNIQKVLGANFDPGEETPVYSELQTFRGNAHGKFLHLSCCIFFVFY